MIYIKFTLLTTVILFLVSSNSFSQNKAGEEINWDVIASGGGEVASTNYKVNVTIGQSVAGLTESVEHSLHIGFWQNFVIPPSCCVMRGDVQNPKDGKVLVNDLVFLVNYVFKGGPLPNCPEEGDVKSPLDGYILVNDLVYLVNDVFKGGPPPPAC